jgi:hypothetical protein
VEVADNLGKQTTLMVVAVTQVHQQQQVILFMVTVLVMVAMEVTL